MDRTVIELPEAAFPLTDTISERLVGLRTESELPMHAEFRIEAEAPKLAH